MKEIGIYMPKGYKKVSTFSPQQKQLFQQLMASLGGMGGQGFNLQQSPLFQGPSSFLQSLYSPTPETMAQFQAPYIRQFQQQTIPGLAERFAGMGAGAQSSSGFQQALGQAGGELSENLAALRGQMQLAGLGPSLQYAATPFEQLMSLLGMNTQALMPKSLSFGKQLGLGLAGGLGSGIGSLFGRLF